MKQKLLPKKDLPNFLSKLQKTHDLIAPVKGKVTRFEKIKDPNKIYLDTLTHVPLKQFFLPEKEALFTYDGEKIISNKPKIKKRIIFGMRKCDLNALQILDKVMFDQSYRSHREASTLIGIYCDSPDEYCFCNSMELTEYYDLFFYPEGNDYYISIGSKKGQQLVKNLPEAKKEVIKNPTNTKALKNKDIEKDYNNPLWKSDIEKCLSCAACTVYCPTCNCFDIKDTLNIDVKKGTRIKNQTSCQLQSFTEVAGGKVFRESRESRLKHFIYHKTVYYKKKFNRYMCVGCGRCLRACPPNIDWVETINKIKGIK